MDAVAYLRVSTEGQLGEDKFGLASQREAIERYAAAEGLNIVYWYEDAGISGATLERPALSRLLNDSTAGTFGAVIVAKMDRLARDLLAQLWLEKELLRSKVEVISAAEPFRGQDPSNKLFRQIIGAFAEFEKSRIADRLGSGRKAKARAGGYSGGGAVLGYRAVRGSKVLVVDEREAAIVRRIFALKDGGMTTRAIAATLNAEGFTTRQGKAFQSAQITRVIQHRGFYEGRYSYSGIASEGRHEPIL